MDGKKQKKNFAEAVTEETSPADYDLPELERLYNVAFDNSARTYPEFKKAAATSYGKLPGKDLYFIFQGAAPTEEQLKNGEYTIKRYAELYGMNYISMASNQKEAQVLAEKI